MNTSKKDQLWNNRSHYGRDKLFASPALLWQAVCKYFEWCENNPWHKHELLKSGNVAGTVVGVPAPRPYTYTGLCVFLGCSRSYFWSARKRAIKADDNELLVVLDLIDNIIHTQQFEGATIGLFNTAIISKGLNLEDNTTSSVKADNQAKIEINVITNDCPPLASSEDEVF